jgi:acyl-coenzyme A synthetase/AMP-(fatty) acid ligase
MNNLWSAFELTVARVPERPAIVTHDQTHCFSEWAQRAEDFRSHFIDADLKPGDRVLLWVENHFDIAAALVATWGCQAIPVLIDSSCQRPQLEHAVKVVEPRIVVHRQPLPDASLPANLVKLCTQECPGVTQPSELPNPNSQASDPASIVFTSGSTGRPKGVVQSHGNLYRGCRTVFDYLQFKDDDRLLCPVPWSFDYGYGQLLTSIICGTTQALPKVANPFGICEAIELHRPTLLAGTPSLFAYLLGGMSPIKETDLSSIRLLTNTGGKLPADLIDRLPQHFENAELALNYGLTETYRSCFVPPEQMKEKSGSIGIPIPGVEITIVREDLSQAAVNEEGEIVHRGDFTFLGYWGDEDSSNQTLRRDPLSPPGSTEGGHVVYTGDIGYRDEDGFFHFVGRKDQQIKSMGVRVSPTEVEELLHQSGLVSHVAVFAMPHDLIGQEVWAAVVPRDDPESLQKELRKFSRASMSQYMQPRNYLVLDELPRTTSSKVDYPKLIECAFAERETSQG